MPRTDDIELKLKVPGLQAAKKQKQTNFGGRSALFANACLLAFQELRATLSGEGGYQARSAPPCCSLHVSLHYERSEILFWQSAGLAGTGRQSPGGRGGTCPCRCAPTFLEIVEVAARQIAHSVKTLAVLAFHTAATLRSAHLYFETLCLIFVWRVETFSKLLWQ